VPIKVAYTHVHGLRMAYRHCGAGDPVVFVHGNPTSSYMWRAVLERVEHLGRCLAPDLIGMGLSQSLPDPGAGSYRFVEHRNFLEALLEQLGVTERVVLVGHDWGGVLAMDWARRHPAAVRGIAYLETLTGPLSWGAPLPELFRQFRTSAGERLVLVDNIFVEKLLPAGIIRRLHDEEMEAYRAPYLQPGESRRPTLTWAQQIPIDGEPGDVHDIVVANGAWMAATSVPKLFINADPGAVLTGPLRQTARSWPHQREITVPGLHFLPEDSPDAIAAALVDWIPTLLSPGPAREATE